MSEISKEELEKLLNGENITYELESDAPDFRMSFKELLKPSDYYRKEGLM